MERLLPLPERDDVQRHVAERELPGGGQDRHRGVGAVEGARAEEREHLRPRRPLDVEAPVLLVEVLRELAVATEEHRTEAEELHLLGVLVVREDVLEIEEPARLGRAPVADAEGELREAHLGDRRGHRRDAEREHRPPAEANEKRGVAGQRDDVLDEPKALGHQRDRARRGLAPSARELVVKLGVLEEAQLEPERLLEDRDVDVDPEPRAEQLRTSPSPRWTTASATTRPSSKRTQRNVASRERATTASTIRLPT